MNDPRTDPAWPTVVFVVLMVLGLTWFCVTSPGCAGLAAPWF